MIKKYLKLSDSKKKTKCYFSNKNYIKQKIFEGGEEIESVFDILKNKKYFKLFIKYFDLEKYKDLNNIENILASHVSPKIHKEDLELFEFIKDKDYVYYKKNIEKKIYEVVIIDIKEVDSFLIEKNNYSNELSYIIVIGYECDNLDFEKFIKCVEYVKYKYENVEKPYSCGTFKSRVDLRFLKFLNKKNILNKYISLNQLA